MDELRNVTLREKLLRFKILSDEILKASKGKHLMSSGREFQFVNAL